MPSGMKKTTSRRDSPSTTCVFQASSPPSARTSPAAQASNVLLPDPFGPMMPRTSPGRAVKPAPRSAWVGPNCLEIEVATSTLVEKQAGRLTIGGKTDGTATTLQCRSSVTNQPKFRDAVRFGDQRQLVAAQLVADRDFCTGFLL